MQSPTDIALMSTTRRVTTQLLVCGMCAMTLCASVRPAEAVSPEYKLKALVLFSFAKFVEWPPEAFSQPDSPIMIGVLGDDPFEEVLDQIVRGRTINGRPLVIKRSKRVQDLKSCNVLFISSSEQERESQILASLQGLPVLTVGETQQFLSNGGIIRLKMKQQKVRFNIRAQVAERAGLKLSSQLLSLATDNREDN
jgi:hypothetical protein